MADIQHKLAEPEKVDHAAEARHARFGLFLFVVYALLYGAFTLLNAFAPRTMDTVVVAGINLAVLYGLALIAAAIILAFVYVWLCRSGGPRRLFDIIKGHDRSKKEGP